MTVARAVSTIVAEPTEPLTVDSAYAHAHRAALVESPVGTVGLEIETHLVDLGAVAERVGWTRVTELADEVQTAAGRSAVTLEPGGQLELSGPPAPGIAAALREMRHDVQRVRLALAEHGLGLAHVGADPLRQPRRVNPRARYRAMEAHFAATGRAGPGAAMMCSTAALQVNLQAGPAHTWAARVAQAHRLGPTLVAISACSPWLAGSDSGWKSARQRVWGDLNAGIRGPAPEAPDPAAEWARYAMRAPVVLLADAPPGQGASPVCTRVPFAHWASGAVPLGGRLPRVADLDTHLTTLFPPVRRRGYLELRYLDMTPPRWWPAVAAVATTLMDDPVAADAAAEATESTARLWTEAAREGLGHPALAASARRCLQIAADRVAPQLVPVVADLAGLVDAGTCPGDLWAQRIGEIGPDAAFEEAARA